MKKLTLISAAAILLSAPAIYGATIIVDDDGPADHTSIHAAIGAAASGDQVEVRPGTYNEAIDFNGKAIKLYSTGGPQVTIIDASGTDEFHVVQCVNKEGADTILEGFTITGGNADLGSSDKARGGGMYNKESSPTVINCVFTGNFAKNGGGMFNMKAHPRLTGCTFSNNNAEFEAGGLHNHHSDAIVVDCDFIGNIADANGGGMHNAYGDPTVTGCTFMANEALDGGGMYNRSGSKPAVTDCTFAANMAAGGGGMYNDSSDPEISGCEFIENQALAGNGGGMLNLAGSKAAVINCIFTNNTANIGGGMANEGNSAPTVTDCTFEDNIAYEGGGMYNNASEPNVSGCSFVDNEASAAAGGGMRNVFGCNVTVTDCTFSGNLALAQGGGICNWHSKITVTGSVFSRNDAFMDGGGIENNMQSDLVVTDCTFIDNSSVGYGGGLNNIDCNSTVTDCTFSDNSATWGGGMANPFVSLQKVITVSNCTFNNNTSRFEGGGVYNDAETPQYGSGAVIVTDCVFNNNRAGHRGGGMGNSGGDVTTTDCRFSNNLAGFSGGGMDNVRVNLSVVNCIFRNNTSYGYGGAIQGQQTGGTMTNCTFSGNHAIKSGGAIYCYFEPGPMLTNCILWGNAPNEIDRDGFDFTDVVVSYSDVEGGWPGVGNIDADPLFALSGDMHLLPGSPCIDAGSNAPEDGLPDTDLEGAARILDGDEDDTPRVDMGAYEFDPNPPGPRFTLWPIEFEFIAYGGKAPEPQMLEIRNIGSGALNWRIDVDSPWLELNRTGGESSGEIGNVILDPNISQLDPGEHYCELTISDANAVNSPIIVPVVLNVGRILNVPSGYSTIQFAIDDSNDGDIVLVADGTYYENDLDFGGRAIMVKSENGPENCVIDCDNRGRGFHFHSGETHESVLDGFTIQDANAPEDLESGRRQVAGGIYCEGASPVIRRCRLNNCNASNGGGIYAIESNAIITDCQFNNCRAKFGGGMYNSKSMTTVINCTFIENKSFRAPPTLYFEGGGGMYNSGSSLVVRDCTFAGNSSDGSGGGMHNIGEAYPTVANCIFTRNSASFGGGMCNDTKSKPRVINCTFSNNSSSSGGGMGNYESSPTVTNCGFSGNVTDANGAGMYNSEEGYPTVVNCIFSKNRCLLDGDGGGMYNRMGSPTVTNSTFVGNVAANGAGMYNYNVNFSEVTNCILWGDDPSHKQIYDHNSLAIVTYSLLEDANNVYGGAENYNISKDPLFVDADANDFRLQVMSPCIDVGRNIAGLYSDIRGSVRPIDVVSSGEPWNNDFDMGAYEYSDYYSGTEDGVAPAFRDVEMPSFCLVGESAEIRWKNHPGFPDDDRRIRLPAEYKVNLVLVSEDRTRQIKLNLEPITVSSTTAAPDIPYREQYTFRQIHAGTWHLRVELSEDNNQYVESARTFFIGLRQPKLYEIGGEITPPFEADLDFDPIIEEGREDYFYWSEHARKLYAIGPIAAVVEWTDKRGDPMPILVGNVWPNQMQIHVADSPAIELLPETSPYTFVEVRYADNDAAVSGSAFSATSEGRCVLMYGDNANYEFVPEFEVVRTVLWNNPEFLVEEECIIGTEVSEFAHNEDCGSGHIYQEVSPYDAATYDRDTRSGQIFAVNLDDPCSMSDDLIVFWYEKGKFGASWPYLPMRYDPSWPATPGEGLEKIVIASLLGSEIDDQNSLDGSHINMQIYNQPDRALPGYNPNEEHAAFFPSNNGSGYQALYALRNDLNRTDWGDSDHGYTSGPYVLLKYQDIYERWYYRVFKVLLEEGEYELRYRDVAGLLVEPPYPITRLMPRCNSDSYPDLPGPWWADYNGDIWARCSTEQSEPGTIRWFYPLQPGYWYDLDDDGVEDKPAATCVPWLDHHPSTDPNIPIAVEYDVNWPDDVPELEVGETLMKPKPGRPGKLGRPDIMNQCSVEIIFDEPNEVLGTTGAVKLIEPLSEHRVSLLSLPNQIKVSEKGNLKMFDDLPFHLRTRCYYDPLDQELVFRGYFDDTVAGEPILLLNIMSAREREELRSLPGADSVFRDDVNELHDITQMALEGNQTRLGPGAKALSAGTAGGTGYVTLAFAGDPDCSPLPVSVSVIKVGCGPYRGELKVIESDNVFDERITFRHSGDFGGKPEGREFMWKRSDSLDEPNAPDRPRPGDIWESVTVENDGYGIVEITVGGAGLDSVKDMWFSCSYRDELCGRWSEWTEPQLHESWLKRVNRQVNLFDQRFKDFHESEINTLVSMISQIGGPYEGDVALTADPENINSMGLLELYETLFNRAAKFSINAVPGQSDPVANRTLLFATSRIASLYTLMGNEAYADALDPTIGFTTEGADYSMMAPVIHCFQNQTDSLLSEELALLRGLADRYPSPIYNRLIWNFTSGNGEVAYASNYVITDMDDDGDTDEYDAAIMFPQGHGDAWGHYLTALKKYYHLLVHPNYEWLPQHEYVLVSGTPVEVDYFDERHFAKIATAKAKTGAEIVDLTYRQKYDEDPENQWQGYKDHNVGWGVAGWASRAGQGAYFDWVVANALLPDVDPNENHTGVQKVDRTTVIEIREIAGSFNDIQAKLDMADLGLNPLGVAKDAVPFDINPFELVDAHGQPAGRTHFEQIYDRAVTALNNALTTFNFANQSTQLLRRQQDSLEDFTYNVAQRELDFKNRQIEIFGYPYDDDIGPTGTYPEGYDGPDIYHYMYADPSELMSSGSPETVEYTVVFREPQVSRQGALSYVDKNVVFHLSPHGLGFIKPSAWTGSRRAPGELQMARSDLLQTKANFDRSLIDYRNLLAQIEDQVDMLEAQYNLDRSELYILNKTHDTQESLNVAILAARGLELMFRGIGRRAVIAADAAAEFIPTSVGFSNDVGAPGRGAAKLIGAALNESFSTLADVVSVGELAAQQAKERSQSLSNIEITAERHEFAELQQLQQLEQLVRAEASQRLGLFTLAETMQQSSGRYLAALARGQRLYEEMTRFRMQTAADIQHYRYNDMTFRILRNDALQKYRAQFDLAAMYTYLAAKAYDYETALLDDYSEAGQHFLNRIVWQRTLGQMGQTGPVPGDGLAGLLGELRQNFDVFKVIMGFNSPQIETTWFSLRKEHFRITQNAVSNSDWQKAIDKYYVEDLWGIPEFRRYCKPFDTQDVVLPGFVIPFQTNITNGLNFFGWPGGADPFYAPENCVTKIRSVGIWFSNYDQSIMSPTPRVYLIPVGQDVMRADIGEIRSWQVVEQSIPLPFEIGENDLANNFEWIPMNDTVPGPLAQIRRYTRFRAYPDGGFDPSEMTYDSRLVGRSVWNTRWLLIIPGHSLYLSDPWEGMERFIYGAPIPSGDGQRTGNGITDIKLFFKTYAYPGY